MIDPFYVRNILKLAGVKDPAVFSLAEDLCKSDISSSVPVEVPAEDLKASPISKIYKIQTTTGDKNITVFIITEPGIKMLDKAS